VRDLAGKPVAQVLLGGDSGTTLRDLFAAAALLKSKRVPPRLDLLLAVPSRQMLEVLASTGALTDLIATGARVVEPDSRVMSGALYPPAGKGTVSLRATDPEPFLPGRPGFVIASAETLAYAVAAGEVGDPRLFKRPVRVTVPRVLPTDDVLVARERRAGEGAKRLAAVAAPLAGLNGAGGSWKAAESVELVDAVTFVANRAVSAHKSSVAVVCTTLDQVRHLAGHSHDIAGHVRAVLAPFIPSTLVGLLSAVGIAALQIDAAGAKGLAGEKSLLLPPPSRWASDRTATVVPVGKSKVSLTWLASVVERGWTGVGSARPPAKEATARRA
jgi:aconitate hydratase